MDVLRSFPFEAVILNEVKDGGISSLFFLSGQGTRLLDSEPALECDHPAKENLPERIKFGPFILSESTDTYALE
jgi:hypothetical protein